MSRAVGADTGKVVREMPLDGAFDPAAPSYALATRDGSELDVRTVASDFVHVLDQQLRSSRCCAREVLLLAIGAEEYDRLLRDLAGNLVQTVIT